MLKEVGASGQISLGKKFAGQLFDVSFLETGEVQMKPVRVVSAMPPVGTKPAALQAEDAQWLDANASKIAAYNAWAEARPTFSESVRQWRESQEADSSAS
jgi:post-segregation antitoxin (ccd killing protein)